MSNKFKWIALGLPLAMAVAACGPQGPAKTGQEAHTHGQEVDKSGQKRTNPDKTGHAEDSHDHDHDHDDHAEGDSHDGHGHGHDGHGHGHDEDGEDHVELSPEAAREAGIRTSMASLAPLGTTLKLPAEIRFDADRIANVSARVDGVVTRLGATEGASVRKGDTLAVINSRELAGLKADYLTAMAAEALARDTLMREETLFQQKITAEADLQAARAGVAGAEASRKAVENKLHAIGVTHATLDRLSSIEDGALGSFAITAPIGGRVVRRSLSLGETVSGGSGAPLFVIADDSVLWADIAVYKNDYGRLREGMAVTLRQENGVAAAEGTIGLILPLIDEASRTATARVIVDNKEGRLRPGQFVTAEIAAGDGAQVLRVPDAAIVQVEGRASVFVPTDDGFAPRAIEAGGKAGGFTEIRSGLSAGDAYVSEGAFTLKAQLEKDAFGDGHVH